MIDQLLKQIAGGGWSELDNAAATLSKMTDEQSKAEREEIERQAAIIAGALGTADGKALIELLLQITIMRQPDDIERGAQTADAYAIAKAKREGQNSIVFFLLARLQQKRGQEAVKQPGGEL
jgi:hypothetical protein